MRYWQAVLIKELKWAWKTRQLGYLKVLRAFVKPKTYQVWWNQQITRVYREKNLKGSAFYKNTIGLPKPNDKIEIE